MATVIVGSRVCAEKIVQDAFVTMADRASQLESPGGYLRTSVVSGCRMALRLRAVEQRHAVVVDQRDFGAGLEELVELRDDASKSACSWLLRLIPATVRLQCRADTDTEP
jgi:hypothetical protein